MLRLLTAVLIVFLSGCVSADYEAVAALRVGMSKEEARGAIESHGFKLKEDEVFRPASGWPPKAKGYFDVSWRAGVAESRSGAWITSAEAYPVSHGLLGYSWIYLFYGADAKLTSFYRLQIN